MDSVRNSPYERAKCIKFDIFFQQAIFANLDMTVGDIQNAFLLAMVTTDAIALMITRWREAYALKKAVSYSSIWFYFIVFLLTMQQYFNRDAVFRSLLWK